MRSVMTFVSLALLSASAVAQFNGTINVNCAHGESLQTAINFSLPGTTIVVKGACTGPVSILTPGLKLDGKGTGSINGAGHDAVTINGAQRVMLSGLTIGGGNDGVVVENNAQATLTNVNVSGNALTGVSVFGNSSVTVRGGGSLGNGLFGADVENTSSLNVNGAYAVTGNAVFGIEVNNESSLNLAGGNLTVNSNVVGVQVSTNSSGFMDGASTLNVSNNFALGLTTASGGHMVDFGGTIVANVNGLQGIAVDSKSGLDLDAGAQVQANNNAGDGVHMEVGSSMTVFNTPQFSNVPGTTTLTAQGNGGNGINLLSNSTLYVVNYAALQVSGNAQAGVAADDGSALTFAQSVPVSGVTTSITGNHPDTLLTFGSRMTLVGNDTVGTQSCDATALARGPGATSCPH